eukprot:gene13603-biopygen23059
MIHPCTLDRSCVRVQVGWQEVAPASSPSSARTILLPLHFIASSHNTYLSGRCSWITRAAAAVTGPGRNGSGRRPDADRTRGARYSLKKLTRTGRRQSRFSQPAPCPRRSSQNSMYGHTFKEGGVNSCGVSIDASHALLHITAPAL